MALPDAIRPITEDEDQYARILIHGDSGVGKSTFAAGSPRCLMLFNDPDEGRFPKSQGTDAYRWIVRDYDDLTEAIEFLKLGDHDFEWVWFDNSSLFQDQGMQQIMEDLVMAKPHRNKWIPDKAEYMLNQQRLSFLIREMCMLEMNVGLIANTMTVEDDEGREIRMPLYQGGQGAFSNKVCGMMSVVGHMEITKAKRGEEIVQVRRLITDKQEKVYAKDRYGQIGTILNPSMEKVLDKIEVKAKKVSPRKVVAKKAATRRSTAKKPVGRTTKKTAATRRPANK